MLFVPSNSHMEQPIPKLLKNCTSEFTLKKTNLKPPLGIPIIAMSKLSMSIVTNSLYIYVPAKTSNTLFPAGKENQCQKVDT